MNGDEACRVCGIDLAKQHEPFARLMSWPQPLLPGDLPSRDELCEECQTAVSER